MEFRDGEVLAVGGNLENLIGVNKAKELNRGLGN
jgi:hypothetical protein